MVCDCASSVADCHSQVPAGLELADAFSVLEFFSGQGAYSAAHRSHGRDACELDWIHGRWNDLDSAPGFACWSSGSSESTWLPGLGSNGCHVLAAAGLSSGRWGLGGLRLALFLVWTSLAPGGTCFFGLLCGSLSTRVAACCDRMLVMCL